MKTVARRVHAEPRERAHEAGVVVVVPGPGVDDERLVAVADHMDVHVGQEGAVHAKLDAPDLGLLADERASEAVGVEREAPGVADGPVDTRVPLTRHGGAPLC